ncbi:hypothetical protein VPH35_059566 [Triticum aestivum]
MARNTWAATLISQCQCFFVLHYGLCGVNSFLFLLLVIFSVRIKRGGRHTVYGYIGHRESQMIPQLPLSLHISLQKNLMMITFFSPEHMMSASHMTSTTKHHVSGLQAMMRQEWH